jgi:nucleoside-diphosphate-sugar epimerase
METNSGKHPNVDLGHCLVTGAAGYVGSHLVKALLQPGHKVRALVRSAPLALEHENLECFSGDVQNTAQMMQACDSHASQARQRCEAYR